MGGAPAEAAPFLRSAEHGSVLDPKGEAPLVELLEHLVERLLPEVGDVEQIVQGAVDQFADGVDLRPLEAVAGTLGEVEVLDAKVEVGRPGADGADFAQFEAHRLVLQVGHQADQGAEGVTGRGQCLTGRERSVGLDVQHQPVEVGGLLHPDRLHGEGHPPNRREDGIDRDHPDGGGPLRLVGRQVPTAALHGEVDGQTPLGVERGDVLGGAEDLHVGGELQVAGGGVAGPALVEADGHRLVAVHPEQQVLQVEDEVGRRPL